VSVLKAPLKLIAKLVNLVLNVERLLDE
jgi:hypothetical protein